MSTKQFHNVILLGTSHIARQSIVEVERAVETFQPSIVALELDKERFLALQHGQKGSPRLRDIKHFGVKGFLFAVLGAWAERKLGEVVGVAPGDEMKKGILLAKQHGAKIALLDQPLNITLKRISKRLTWKEKGRFFIDVFRAVFFKEKEFQFDLRKVPENEIVKKMVGLVKVRYPTLYEELIVQRNQVMGGKLHAIMENHPDVNILALVGAGHVDGILDLLRMCKSPSKFSTI